MTAPIIMLAAPFRTDLNMRTLRADRAPHILADSLRSAATIMNQSANHEGVIWSPGRQAVPDGELRFEGLHDDRLPVSWMPLMRLRIPSGEISKMVSSLETDFGGLVGDAHIDYFDNTIAVLWASLAIRTGEGDDLHLRSVDLQSTRFCSTIVDQIQQLELQLMQTLLPAANNSRDSPILRPEDAVVFRGSLDTTLSATRSRLLWTTRVLCCSRSAADSDAVAEWVAADIQSLDSTSIGSGCFYALVGNSVSVDADIGVLEDSLQRSLVPLLAGFALLDVLQSKLKQQFLDLAMTSRLRTEVIERITRTLSLTDYIRAEYRDLLRGLQGGRSRLATAFLVAWEFEEFSSTLTSRQSALSASLGNALQARQRRYSIAIEAVLTVLGGLALLDFTLNLAAYAHSSAADEDSVPGLVDLARAISVNGGLYAMLVLIAPLTLLVSSNRK